MVMLLPYQNQPRIGWKPSGNRYNGTYGLQVWKVAQLVEQETIPSPRFDSWLSDSLKRRPSQNTFFKQPVEIWGVLLYYKRKYFGRFTYGEKRDKSRFLFGSR